ncbi:MAG: dihydroneopterin aldolase [Aliidongia sp.]
MTSATALVPRIATVSPSCRLVLIRDLVMLCSIGVHAHEHDAKQRIRLNLELDVTESVRPIEDDLRNVVCYDEIISAVRRLVDAGHVRLIETLAERIAALCLGDPAYPASPDPDRETRCLCRCRKRRCGNRKVQPECLKVLDLMIKSDVAARFLEPQLFTADPAAAHYAPGIVKRVDRHHRTSIDNEIC